jgi:hypothetical protein
MQKAHGLKVEMEVGMAGGGLVWFGLVLRRTDARDGRI